MSKRIETIAIRTEELTPRQFVHLIDTNRTVIRTSRVRPPRLGEKGFGTIIVEYTRPVHRWTIAPGKAEGA